MCYGTCGYVNTCGSFTGTNGQLVLQVWRIVCCLLVTLATYCHTSLSLQVWLLSNRSNKISLFVLVSLVWVVSADYAQA